MSEPRLRTLMVSSKDGMEGDGWPPRDQIRALIDGDRISDILALHDALGVRVLDGQYIAALPGPWGRLLRRIPFRVAQAAEIFRRRRELDLILTWGERDAVRIGAMMQLLRRRPAHVSILFWISRWRKALPLRLFHRGIDRIIIGAPLQFRFARETLRLPTRKVAHIPWGVDTRFWRPMPGVPAEDMICAVGLEMRDYDTFLDALRPLGLPCYIAAGNRKVTRNPDAGQLPDSVTVGRKSMADLRELYARVRFVVIPLLPSDSDQGITTCLEAMAMGKAVICTDTAGQVGLLEDGVNSVRVPPGDPVALRGAMDRLWDDPGLCARLGAAGRKLVQERYGLDTVVPSTAALCQEAVAERSARKS